MRRVAIVGVPGAGKSTLARAIGQRRSLPVIHLDAHYFNPGWTPKGEDEWLPVYDDLVSRDEWVMDGAFAMDKALDRADTASSSTSHAGEACSARSSATFSSAADRLGTSRRAAASASTNSSFSCFGSSGATTRMGALS